MEMALVYYVALLLFGFVSMYCTFAPLAKSFEKSGRFSFFMQPILHIFVLYVLGSIGAYYLTDNSDFLLPPAIYRIIIPLFCAGAIYAAEWYFGEKIKIIVLLLSVALCVFIQPAEDKFIPFGLNEYVFKILTTAFLFVFCLYYKILNILPHTIVIVTTTMLAGISLLSGVGGAPVYLALVSSVLIGSLLAFLGVNLQQVKIEFNDISCTVLAFLVSNIFIYDMSELSFMSCIIFSMIFWAELAIVLYRKFFVTKTGSLIDNSHLWIVAQNVTLAALMSSTFKIGLVCMFFGWFQLFAVNQYSLPIVAFFVVLWLNTSIGSDILQKPKTLKQINSEFIADIKKNIQETKDTISQISNKKD